MLRLAPAFVVVTSLGCATQAPVATPAEPVDIPAVAGDEEHAPDDSAADSPGDVDVPSPVDASAQSPTDDAAVDEPRVVVVATSNPPAVTHVLFPRLSAKHVAQSSPVLDEVAARLREHPQITKGLVEGHADASVPAAQAKTLAQQRADAVRQALIGRGIAAERLEAKGVAAACPFAPSPSDANDRVVFHILEKDGVTSVAGCPTEIN